MKSSWWVFLFILSAITLVIILMPSSESQHIAYLKLKALAEGEKRDSAAPLVVHQRRRDISKLFLAGGMGEQQHLSMDCETAELVIRREKGRVELLEEMEGVEAELHQPFSGSQRMLRHFSASHAFYYPRRRSLLARDVVCQQRVECIVDLPEHPAAELHRCQAAGIAVYPTNEGFRWRARGLQFEENLWMP